MDVAIIGLAEKVTIRGFDKIGDVNVVMLKGQKGDKGDPFDPPVITSTQIDAIINSIE